MSTHTKHTPGPWKAQLLNADGVVIRKTNYEINTPEYDVATFLGQSAPIRKKADALLIAASPDLLDACRVVLPWLESKGAAKQDIATVRAAIRKAIEE